MVSAQKKEKSLQNRINDYLSSKPVIYGVIESEEDTIETLTGELNKAEEDLEAVHERIRRLKWALAKAKS